MDINCIILAAGKGTRMKSDKAKVLHEVCFKPLLHYPVKLARELSCGKIVVVVGHQEDEVKRRFGGERILFASQKEQLGTGHAASCALDILGDDDMDVLIICSDSPFLRNETIAGLHERHTKEGAVVSILTAKADDPTNYGRIVRDAAGDFLRIVEEKDADTDTRRVKEINTGTYIVNMGFLRTALKKISNDNVQKEYYLTDITGIAVSEGGKVVLHQADTLSEVMGINTRHELALANGIRRREINRGFMLSGVTMIDPAATYIEEGVKISADTVIHPGAMITGATTIEAGVTIGNGCIISDSVIGARCDILPYTMIDHSVLEDDVRAGPFARIRPETLLKEGSKIGNFVELKKSTIGKGSKVNHLSYVGDAAVGEGVNIGAGTITCNYDGVNKYKTEILDGASIGSNTAIVAPVTVNKGALVGAGSVITKDVPENTVAVERTLQRHYKKRG